MVELHQNRELSGDELTDLGSFVNTIVTHITDGNTIEKEATSIMGGTAYETESERIRRVAREEMRSPGQSLYTFKEAAAIRERFARHSCDTC